ncbi:MAG: ABC transporter ATP-binding protein [Vicinamibacterales bacterium]
MLAIETENLTKDYLVGFWKKRPYRALDRLDLAVEPGDVFGFLGPNGAGKSTTIKLLMQLIYPTSGSARILGRPVGDVDVRRRIGFLAENPSYYDYLTAEELLTYFAGLFDVPAADRAARVSKVLDEVGLGAERRMRLRSYSKGMVQRVGIAQALINEPEIVFLDEPMSGLDPLGRRDVRQIMLRLRDRGCTVFFSSHILSDAEALCNRIAIVAQGRLAAAGQISDIVGVDVLAWELVADRVSAETLDALRPRARTITALHDGRYAIELPPDAPESALQLLSGAGARVVSLNPVRKTLEDYFVQQVQKATARETSL